MKKIRTLRMLVSCIVAVCLLSFIYFVNYKMETLQPAEFTSSVSLYFIVFIAFVFGVGEVYSFLKKLEKNVTETKENEAV